MQCGLINLRVEFAGARVTVRATGRYREIELRRPSCHNAIDPKMRDELLLVLRAMLAARDRGAIGLVGAGPSFCSGGDLTHFSPVENAPETHVIRSVRSLPYLMEALAPRMVVGVHGACIGAGLELAAFARMVVAAHDTKFLLPEVNMGLLPGMGGTVSISRRIGTTRTLWMLLAGMEVDSGTAKDWGLVDALVDEGDLRADVRSAAKGLCA
jgi:enoyl-CoA hydratase/carnithine racemase